MRIRVYLGLLLSVLLVTTTGVEAQLGGLLKKKLGDVVGEKGKPAPPAPVSAPATPAAEQTKSGSALGCDVSGNVMDQVLKGLEAERAERDAALKAAAAAKSPAQFQACQNELAVSPEYQKAAAPLLSMPDNVTPADYQRIAAKVSADVQAVTDQKCGATPSDTRSSLNSRFDQAEKLGPDTAGVGECYVRIQEHAVRFCQLPAADQEGAVNAGLRVPGTGKDVFWVFTKDEAKAYKPVCDRLMSLATALKQQDEQKQSRLK